MDNLVFALVKIILFTLTVCFFYYVRPRKRVRWLRRGLIAFSFFAFLSFMLFSSRTNNPLYTVEARTEYLDYVSSENEGRINVDNVIFNKLGHALQDSVSGSVSLELGVKIRIHRIGEGRLQIFLSLPGDADGLLGYFERSDSIKDTLYNAASFELLDPVGAVKNGKHHLVYFEGNSVNIGQDVVPPTTSATSPILQGGVLTANDKVILGQDRYESIRYELGYGEKISFDTETVNGRTLGGIGFAVLDDGPGVKVVYNVNANYARVSKVGFKASNKYFIIKPTLLSRLSSDGLLQTLSFFFAGLIVITTIWTFYYDTRAYHELKNNSK